MRVALMDRLLVTGTDTDVGKTRVSAAFAQAMIRTGSTPTIVKLVQTGARERDSGDAQRAGELAGCAYLEGARFFKPADPWSAALAEGMPPVRAEDLQKLLGAIEGSVVAEGAGGLAVPVNAKQTFADVAQLCKLSVVVVVGLRLGCINHALLTAAHLAQRNVPLAGAVLCERWEAMEPDYRKDVTRGLQGKMDVLGIIPFEVDERRSVEQAADIFEKLVG
ncbi:MAG: hypothetical protein NVS9B12_08530 [Vulcanimicrobiaceae bacterium]